MRSDRVREGVVSPSHKPEVPSPVPSTYEPSHVIQLLVQLNKDVASLATKTDRVIEDVKKLDSNLDTVRHKISRAEGVVICGVVLLAVFAGLIWWLVGGQINDLRDELLKIQPEQKTTTP